MTSKVLRVLDIELSIEKSNPPSLVIKAKGEVQTGGWTKGHLSPYVYIVPPADGIYEFDFLADAPEGIVTQGLSKIESKPFIWKDFSADLVGVKVYASQNSRTKQLSRESKVTDPKSVQKLEKVTAEELQNERKSSDQFSIEHVFVWEHSLEVRVRYSGGCKKHDFKLLWDGTKRESHPVQIPLVLVHDNNGDSCKAIVTETLQFDLSEVLNHGVNLDLEGWDNLIKF